MTTVQPIGQRPAWVDDELFPFQSRFVELDGNVVHYVDEGSGPVLLLLHSSPVWSFVWREVIIALRDRFRCIALDFPGFGLSSSAPGYRYRAPDHSELLVSFIDKLDLSQVTMVGHSWGGAFGLYAVLERPERFDRLVLTNTWAWPLNGDLSSEFFSRTMGSALGRALNKQFNLFVNFFIPSAHKRRKLSDAEMAHYRDATPTLASRAATAALPGELIGAREYFTDLESRLGGIATLPTLILWADADPIFTAKYRERWEEILPDPTVTVLHGVGHFLPSDAPAEFSEAVETWWAKVSSSSAP